MENDKMTETAKYALCPECHKSLSKDSALCAECSQKQTSNMVASMLNVVPGLGHIYKGHVASGFFILILGMPIALSFGLILLIPTVGLSLLLPIAFWIWAIVEVYVTADYPHFRHKFLHI